MELNHPPIIGLLYVPNWLYCEVTVSAGYVPRLVCIPSRPIHMQASCAVCISGWLNQPYLPNGLNTLWLNHKNISPALYVYMTGRSR